MCVYIYIYIYIYAHAKRIADYVSIVSGHVALGRVVLRDVVC